MSPKIIPVIAILFVATGILASPAMAEPEYGITYTPETIYVGDTVTFQLVLPPYPTGIYFVKWEFGDGTWILGKWVNLPSYPPPSAEHVYETVDIYTVKARCWNIRGELLFESSVTFTVLPETIPATIDIDPYTLNLRSRGKWITAYIEVTGGGLDAGDIDLCSVTLVTPVMETVELPSGEEVEVPITVYHEDDPKYSFVADPQIIDRDGDGVPELMVKFDRQELQVALENLRGDVELMVTGTINGEDFEASDTIRVIMPEKGSK